MRGGKSLKKLAWREYLPMAATIAMWAVAVAAIGHADAARLLAATVFARAIQLLLKLTTTAALKQRIGAPPEVQRQARRYVFNLQLAALAPMLVLVALLTEVMQSIGQPLIAAFLPLLALGMPARVLRFTNLRFNSPNYRLALATGGLAMMSIGWVGGWHAAAFGLAFGAREWIALLLAQLWPGKLSPPKVGTAEPLHFAEVARHSSALGRRLLTYRLSKTVLTIFGPFGSAAARTGRGLNWHHKIEPYLPHHLGGFILFSVATIGGAVFLGLRSDEPAAMVGSAGLFQIGAVTANVILLWRYLPPKGTVVIDDDDDDS